MPWQPAARRKFRSLPTLLRELRRVRRRGRRIVFTNGCFDLLHPGHTQLLERTKRLGDVLVVGLNSDRSVRMLKGARRPIVAARDSAALLAALESVDYIVVFDDRTPRRLIAAIQPDVLVKGADWSAGDIVGRDDVRRYGGRVVRVPLIKGYSTTRLLSRIRARD